MWFAWTIIGICQVYTNRYMKHYWRWGQTLHTGLGIASGLLTLAGIIIILQWLGWAFYFDHWHNVAGILFMFLCEFLVMGGIFAISVRRFANFDWQTSKLLRTSSIHKYFGYFMIFAVQVAMTTGIIRRATLDGTDSHKGELIGLVIFNLVLYFGSLGLGEYFHYKRLHTFIPLKGTKEVIENMGRQQFEASLAQGQQLMLIDNLVIDVKEFANLHPGGRFVIRHNIGTDVSNFFFGGYCLEGNLQGISPGHKHSSYARMIVNDLAVAIYEREIPTITNERVMLSKE